MTTKKTKKLTLRINPENHNKILELAKSEGGSITGWIERKIITFYEKLKKTQK